MRVHFEAKPWDLYVCFGYTLGLLGAFAISGHGTPFAVLLVFLLPGYSTIAAIYPSREDISWGERLALSLVVSVVVTPLLALAINVLGIGVDFPLVVVATSSYVLVLGAAAYVRRLRLPRDRRLAATLELSWPVGEGYTNSDKIVTLALAASVAATVGALAYLIVPPTPAEHYTEFYLSIPSGNTLDYPTELSASESANVTIGISNQEYAAVTYQVRIDLVGLGLRYNATFRSNETVELNRTNWSWFNVALAAGQIWTSDYTFRINATGFWEVQFLLFKDGNFSSAYRELHVYVRVS